jgi:hypothetical protein
MHINSASVDVHCHKIWDSNSFCKNSYENDKFRYGFTEGFYDCTEDVVCTKYSANQVSPYQ